MLRYSFICARQILSQNSVTFIYWIIIKYIYLSGIYSVGSISYDIIQLTLFSYLMIFDRFDNLIFEYINGLRLIKSQVKLPQLNHIFLLSFLSICYLKTNIVIVNFRQLINYDIPQHLLLTMNQSIANIIASFLAIIRVQFTEYYPVHHLIASTLAINFSSR